jgi:peptide-methionine (S)-S-oxide reductase
MNARSASLSLLALLFAGATGMLHAAPPTSNAEVPAGDEVAVFAGGCFWGVEAVFEHVKGVKNASSGYAGGSAITARYPAVSSGRTQHAEAVKVIYDPAQVSYGELLKVFFTVAHDPTQLNRQGPDVGPQYRSAIFYRNAAQKAGADAYIAALERGGKHGKPVVTQVAPLDKFYPAEAYHQDFARRNPNHPYIVYHDAPKVRNLKATLPALYAGR